MKPAAALTLREIRRGEVSDEIEQIDTAGHVTILHAHGVHPDEQLRTRETALKLLATR
ncbi:MAG TPA: hypothetical protein VL287_10870 [Gemmatimonadales bacterium]|jgi:hypothetical protein|nr:hypothetical protein [Gemmatimonadales bacterium]